MLLSRRFLRRVLLRSAKTHSRSVLAQRLQGVVGDGAPEVSVRGSHLALATRQGSQACRWAGVVAAAAAVVLVDRAGVGAGRMGVVGAFVVEFVWLWSGGVDEEGNNGDDCCPRFDWWL